MRADRARLSFAPAAILAALLLADPAAAADNPLVLPAAPRALPLLSPAEAAGLRKDAESLRRKAGLLKEAAGKKYAEAAELRRKAGGHRSEAARRGEELRGKAEQDAALSKDLGDLFGLLTSMGGGGMSGDSAMAAAVTGKLLQDQQAGAAKDVAVAHSESARLSGEAERKAGPLELRADELESEGNKLMQAHNRLSGIANARLLLVAADELGRKAEAGGQELERLRSAQRALLRPSEGR